MRRPWAEKRARVACAAGVAAALMSLASAMASAAQGSMNAPISSVKFAPTLLKDVNPGNTQVHWGTGALPGHFVNGYVVWVSSTDCKPYKSSCNRATLWSTRGTRATTKKIATLPKNSLPLQYETAGGYLYFEVVDPSGGWNILRTDGTTAGTYSVGHTEHEFSDFALVNDTLLVSEGCLIWRIGIGETALTHLVDFGCGGPASASSAIRNGVMFRGLFYFPASRADKNDVLWKTDGTAAGTAVAVPQPDSAYSRLAKGQDPSYVTSASGMAATADAIYFFDQYKKFLWKTEGTAQTTVMLRQATQPYLQNLEGLAPYNPTYFGSIGSVNGTLVGSCTDNGLNWNFCRFDPTTGTTSLLITNTCKKCGRAFLVDAEGDYGTRRSLLVHHSQLHQSWLTDGTPEGTLLLGTNVSRGSFLGGSFFGFCEMKKVLGNVPCMRTPTDTSVKRIGTGYPTKKDDRWFNWTSGYDAADSTFLMVNGILVTSVDSSVYGREMWAIASVS